MQKSKIKNISERDLVLNIDVSTSRINRQYKRQRIF